MLLNMIIVKRLEFYGYHHVFGKNYGLTYSVTYLMSLFKRFIVLFCAFFITMSIGVVFDARELSACSRIL